MQQVAIQVIHTGLVLKANFDLKANIQATRIMGYNTSSYKGVMTSNHITNWFNVELYPGVASKFLLICSARMR
jgi:hypothetical protein